jgi:SAM-dependent methyltransferase
MSAGRTAASMPLPPRDLVQRIGPMGDENPVEVYARSGESDRLLIEGLLPADWSWTGKRVLDFGCGVGRVLRQFGPEADEAEFWGCDLDRPSIEWARENLEPPLNFFLSAEEPGLPQEDGYFDLIFAFSVYTHLTDHWAGWLLEHHRKLADGGFLLATFLGEGMSEHLLGEPWEEDRIGMNPLRHDAPWDHGGPITLNSPWWLRAHWGRAFEIVELRPRRSDDGPSHGIVLARKKPVELTVEDLERVEPDEPREFVAARHHVDQLIAETRELRALALAGAECQARLAALEERTAEQSLLRSLKARISARRARGSR